MYNYCWMCLILIELSHLKTYKLNLFILSIIVEYLPQLRNSTKPAFAIHCPHLSLHCVVQLSRGLSNRFNIRGPLSDWKSPTSLIITVESASCRWWRWRQLSHSSGQSSWKSPFWVRHCRRSIYSAAVRARRKTIGQKWPIHSPIILLFRSPQVPNTM